MMFLFRQQTAYAVRIGDWSSDVCSSDLQAHAASQAHQGGLASQGKMESITDAAPGAVREWFARYGLDRMIHGHTHRPKVHDDEGGTRIVLGDWYEQGSVLRVDPEGAALDTDRKSTRLNSSH